MQTWIFQGNPDSFGIDEYLATWPTEFRWLVTRHADEMQVGDRVFMWRNRGQRTKAVAGIVAEAVITRRVELLPEASHARAFWRGEDSRGDEIRLASPHEVVRDEC
jgi:hypothetical protein